MEVWFSQGVNSMPDVSAKLRQLIEPTIPTAQAI